MESRRAEEKQPPETWEVSTSLAGCRTSFRTDRSIPSPVRDPCLARRRRYHPHQRTNGDTQCQPRASTQYRRKAFKTRALRHPRVAELADALDLGSCAGNGVGVRLPPLGHLGKARGHGSRAFSRSRSMFLADGKKKPGRGGREACGKAYDPPDRLRCSKRLAYMLSRIIRRAQSEGAIVSPVSISFSEVTRSCPVGALPTSAARLIASATRAEPMTRHRT